MNVLWTAAWMLRKRWAEPADLKPCHLALSSSDRLAGILGPVILAQALLMPG